jgi:hypothetical protein
MFEVLRVVALTIFLVATPPLTTVVQVKRFSSIELPEGGHVILRPSATQRVTLLRGSLDYTRMRVTDRGALVIDKCFRKCPKGYRLELEILSPSVNRLSLANGGSIQSRGGFSRQSTLAVDVSHGGTIDARSIVAQRVTASVSQGGRILTSPQASLSARVSNGGAIFYWGDAQVTKSIDHGGVVTRGSADELQR